MAAQDTSRCEGLHLLEQSNGQLTNRKSCENSTEKKSKTIFCCFGKRMQTDKLLVIMTIAGVLTGVLIGFLVRMVEPSETTIELVMFPGEILMRLLKMLIIPIMFTSVVTGLSHLDLTNGRKMGVHAFLYYLATTTLAVFLGIALVCTIKPGNPNQRNLEGETKEFSPVSAQDTFLDLIRNLFPSNIIEACFRVTKTHLTKIEDDINSTDVFLNDTNSSDPIPRYTKTVGYADSTNVLGIISFSIFFGILLSGMGEEGDIVINFIDALNKIFMKMIMIVIWYSPFGICCLIAGNILKMKSFALLMGTIGMYMVTVIIGLIIHALVILPVIYFFMTRKNPYRLYAGVFQAFLTAIGTSSSAGTLPITMHCLEKNVKIDPRVTRFVLPLGATMNMDGTALMEGVAAITIAQIYAAELSAGQVVTISITATLASIGAAAIPSAGLVTLLMVLSAIGLPTDAVALLWSIDWFLDRLRTSVNVLGDCIGAGIVYHLNKSSLPQETNPPIPTYTGGSSEQIQNKDN